MHGRGHPFRMRLASTNLLTRGGGIRVSRTGSRPARASCGRFATRSKSRPGRTIDHSNRKLSMMASWTSAPLWSRASLRTCSVLWGAKETRWSGMLRNLWDRGDVRSLTKTSPVRVTGAHVSIIGHITQDELLRYLDRTEVANGFGNRFVWGCVRRSKLLPDGGRVPEEALRILAQTRARAPQPGQANRSGEHGCGSA